MTDSELFVVRVWRQLAGGFRASVRRVDEDEARHFTQPEEVTQYLSTVAAPADAMDDVARAGMQRPTR
jgi:hypothetical protein